ncbi:MAG: ATP-dependent sacrificial sulfur transferase LarE [Planctomycetales bacterium]|nr:ATP-dependent sacrificial sulfur transferase LarE [Planctomycetales bacterium]
MTVDSSDTSPTHRSPPVILPSSAAGKLVDWFAGHRKIVVAFSGGVDSSVVLAAALRSVAERNVAQRSVAESVVAVTARSPSVAAWQITQAESIVKQLAATHHIIRTDEVESAAYRANDSSRCFHCKSTLYESLEHWCRIQGIEDATIVSGTNADDLGDYRPGIAAGDAAGVQKPLADLGFGKATVREIASLFQLSNHDLPASPCLASRIAYGVAVTPQRLRQVEEAEDFLREMGLETVRVRVHEGDLARIEVPIVHLTMLTDEKVRSRLTRRFVELGFRYITMDLQGFASGSMNRKLVSLHNHAADVVNQPTVVPTDIVSIGPPRMIRRETQ